MTTSTKEITPDIYPSTGAELFNGSPDDSIFWVGKVASMGVVLSPDCHDSLLQFRGNVYVHEMGYLPESALDHQGREYDADDQRSILFAAVEKPEDIASSNGNSRTGIVPPRVVGSARLVMKGDEHNPLPIEEYFPEDFDTPVQDGTSAEVSRYISRHPDTMQQHKVAIALVRAMTYRCVENGVENAYAVLEKKLIDMLNFVGIESEQLGESKYIEDLNGELYPVVFKPFQIIEDVVNENEKAAILREFFKDEQNRGLTEAGEGFYPGSLIRDQ